MRCVIILVCFLTLCPVGFAIAGPTFKFTVKAVDTNGNPISDAETSATFTGSKSQVVEGKTDKNGLFSASGATTPICGVTVKKEGYYTSGYSFEQMILEHLDESEKGLFNRWVPWNPTVEVILKEKRNPIPMYVGGTGGHKEIPIFDQPVGYDLEKNDWVAPYGDGNIKDFIFVFYVSDQNAKSWEEWSCSYNLTFSNDNDGILEYFPPKDSKSEYIWPYEAPETGYQHAITGFNSMEKNANDTYRNETTYNQERNYIFRVRTKVGSKGNIVEAKYGKIRGDIIQGLKTVAFGYSLNPTGTRNLEFSGENLFTSDKNKYPY